jgi:hypothetical protein
VILLKVDLNSDHIVARLRPPVKPPAPAPAAAA